jgi:hypothetical protein
VVEFQGANNCTYAITELLTHKEVFVKSPCLHPVFWASFLSPPITYPLSFSGIRKVRK